MILWIIVGDPQGFFLRLSQDRQKTKRALLKVKQAEAEARKLEAEVKLGRKALPSYVDPDDPEDLDAYKQARKELMDDALKSSQ